MQCKYELEVRAMQSQITVRIDEELNEQINLLSQKLRRKRSDLVRMALEKFISDVGELEETRPYNRVKELIGSVSSGIPNLGEAHREYLVKKFKKDA